MLAHTLGAQRLGIVSPAPVPGACIQGCLYQGDDTCGVRHLRHLADGAANILAQVLPLGEGVGTASVPQVGPQLPDGERSVFLAVR